MKAICTGFVMLALIAFIGCTSASTSEKHAGGGTNPSQKDPIIGTGEGKFDLDPPTLATSVKQGETKQVKIGIKRGNNFTEDVTLKFEGSPDMPKGVSFDPASPKIKHGDNDATVSVKAADDAAVGEFKIKVIGHPTKGPDALNTFTLKIDKK